MDLIASLRALALAEQKRQEDHFVEGVDLDPYLAKLADKAEFLADCRAGRLRGIIAYYCNDLASKRAFISLVLVDPLDRGHGLGKALVSCVMDIARHRGFASCALEVAVTNEAAYSMYRALGFELVEVRGSKHLLETRL